MDRISSVPIASFKTKEEAVKAAEKRPGNEAIVLNEKKEFDLYALNPGETQDTVTNDLGKFGSAKTIIAFSIDKSSDIIDKTLDNISEKGNQMHDIAEGVLDSIAKGAKTKYKHDDNNLLVTDCSGFIRQLTEKVGETSLKDKNAGGIVDAIRSEKGNISRVMKPDEIKAGDIIAFKISKSDISGHAMLADDSPPVPIYNKNKIVGYNIPVIDSTSIGHGPADLRKKGVKTGIGEGVITIGVDSSGKANSVAWGPNFSNKDRNYYGITIGRIDK